MSQPYEIPSEMREFAERSVAQARKAFEGFMGAIHKTADAAGDHPMLSGAKDMSAKAVTFTESNVNAAFDVAEKLIHAKDVQEAMAIQTDYLKAQMETLQSQGRELGETAQKVSFNKP